MNQENWMRLSLIEQGDRVALRRVLENVLNAQAQSKSSKGVPNLKIDPPSDTATSAVVRAKLTELIDSYNQLIDFLGEK